MRPSMLLTVVGLSVLAATALFLPPGSGVHADDTTVAVGDLWFCEPGDSACMTTDSDDVDLVTTINVGDTVIWRWVGSAPHTTTACSGSDFATCDASQGWDSGTQTSGTFLFTFSEPGTFYYKCLIHPTAMRGQIVVQAAQTPAPPSSPAPGAVPPTGGPPPAGDGGFAWWILLAAGGLLLVSGGAALAIRTVRR